MEVLIATGIMAIGLVMVATIFPVGVKLTTLTTERTVGAVVADEAFAKIQLYGLRDFQYWPVGDPNEACTDFQYAIKPTIDFNVDGSINISDVALSVWDEFLYPSATMPAGQDNNYHWSALCRRMGAKDVQVTVFVNRKIGSGAGFYGYDSALVPTIPPVPYNDWPMPVRVEVNREDSKILTIDTAGVWSNTALEFFDDGYMIVDDLTGNKYRVLEVDPLSGTLKLQGDWVGDLTAVPPLTYPVPTLIWVVPPAVGSDRYPCVGVYQKVIRFDDIK